MNNLRQIHVAKQILQAASMLLGIVFLPGFGLAQSSTEGRLVDQLELSFDEVVDSAATNFLDGYSNFDSMYLMWQSNKLNDLRVGFWRREIDEYQFEGGEDDLIFFSYLVATADDGDILAYCEKMAQKIGKDPGNFPVGTCVPAMAKLFLKQIGDKIPREAFKPAILDILWSASNDDIAVLTENFGEFSVERLLRYHELSPEDPLSNHLKPIVNSAPCSPAARDIEELSWLKPLCNSMISNHQNVDSSELTPYPFFKTVVEICREDGAPLRCREELITFHSISGMCVEPLHLPPATDFYQSAFFRSCMSDFVNHVED